MLLHHLVRLGVAFGSIGTIRATTLTVSTTGGNASSPILYGLMFEVSHLYLLLLPLLMNF